MDTKGILLVVLAPLATALAAWLGYIGLTRSKKIDADAAFKALLLEERGKLTPQLTELIAEVTKLNGQLMALMVSNADKDIEIKKKQGHIEELNAHIQSLVLLIQRLLMAEEKWDKGDISEAHRLLLLVGKDRRESA